MLPSKSVGVSVTWVQIAAESDVGADEDSLRDLLKWYLCAGDICDWLCDLCMDALKGGSVFQRVTAPSTICRRWRLSVSLEDASAAQMLAVIELELWPPRWRKVSLTRPRCAVLPRVEGIHPSMKLRQNRTAHQHLLFLSFSSGFSCKISGCSASPFEVGANETWTKSR